MSNQQSARDHLAALVEQTLRSLRPQVQDQTSLMEITVPQLKTLLLIHNQGPLRMGQIASYLGVGMPAVTNLISKLEAKGLVIREHDTKDRRVVFCSTTDWGNTEVDRYWNVRRERINEIINALNEEEVQVTIKAMSAIIRATREKFQINQKDRRE